MTAWHLIKRWLYIVHRWIGIASCLLFAMWFASGLVMIYVPYPSLSAAEQREILPPIDWGRVRIGPGEAERRTGGAAERVRLDMRGPLPVWRVRTAGGSQLTLSAADGQVLPGPDAREAAVIAGAPAVAAERVERDQWTVAGGYDSDRPLWKVAMPGPGGRERYVSGTTGAVVLETNAGERFWNWLGSVPHWIYPTILRQNQPAWRQTVIWVSGPCILAAITGMWIGILRTRIGRRRFKGGRVTPYHGWMLWHHVAGLVGGIALTTWIVSGWLSVDPGRLFASDGPSDAAIRAFEGTGPMPDMAPARLAAAYPGSRRIGMVRAAGRPVLIVEHAGRPPAPADPATLRAPVVEERALIARARQLAPGTAIARVERLTEPDAYWYEAGALPKLPVLRIVFADPASTWVHLDPETGALLGGIDRRGRIYRWVYQALHTWDLNALTLNRPLWDGLLWLFSLIGLATSVSGVWIGWKRLRRSGRTAPARG